MEDGKNERVSSDLNKFESRALREEVLSVLQCGGLGERVL